MIKKLLVFILYWIAFLAIKIPAILLGAIMVPITWKYKDVHYEDTPKILTPWINPEDWTGGHRSYRNSLPKWWINREGEDFKAFFMYHAIRNPANGLRRFEALDLDIDPEKVTYVTSMYLDQYEPKFLRDNFPDIKTAWYLCWQGNRAGFQFIHIWNDERYLVFKFGWRIQPQDKYVPIDPDGVRVEDAGFATKFLPYRRG